MIRRFLVFVLVFSFALSFASSVRADDSAASAIATPEQVNQTTATLNRFAELVSNHDPAALTMATDKGIRSLFGTTDPTTLQQYLAMKFPTEIYPVENVSVTVPSKGKLAATVSLRGFYTANGYYTIKFRFLDKESGLMIDSAKQVSPVLPKGVRSGSLKINIVPDVPATISSTEVDGTKTGFVVISIKSSDAQTHVITLVEPGNSPLDPANWLGMATVEPNKKVKMALYGLSAGDYQVVDSTMAADTIVSTITVK